MKRVLGVSLGAGLMAATVAWSAAALELPSDQQVTGIVKLCAVGRVQTIQGDVEGKIRLWKQQAQAKGSASLEDLGAILNTVNHGQQVSVDIYKTYTECIKDSVSQFLKAHTQGPSTTNVCASQGVAVVGNVSGPITNNVNGGRSAACPPGK